MHEAAELGDLTSLVPHVGGERTPDDQQMAGIRGREQKNGRHPWTSKISHGEQEEDKHGPAPEFLCRFSNCSNRRNEER